MNGEDTNGEFYEICRFPKMYQAGALKNQIDINYHNKNCTNVLGCDNCGKQEKLELIASLSELNVSTTGVEIK